MLHLASLYTIVYNIKCMMKRITVQFKRREYDILENLAFSECRSLSSTIRNLTIRGLAPQRKKQNGKTKNKTRK